MGNWLLKEDERIPLSWGRKVCIDSLGALDGCLPDGGKSHQQLSVLEPSVGEQSLNVIGFGAQLEFSELVS